MMSKELIIGIDEVGRGSLSGPVVIAGVIMPKDFVHDSIKDSKLLSRKKRNEVLPSLMQWPNAVICIDAKIIDSVNILNATKIGMQHAIADLKHYGNYHVYIDGNQLPFEGDDITAVIGGDKIIPCISAASIIAKCFRDDLMQEYGLYYPQYNWDKNAGYGTKHHINAIREFGATEFHRKSFLKDVLLY